MIPTYVYLAENRTKTVMKIGATSHLKWRMAGITTSAKKAFGRNRGRFFIILVVRGRRGLEKRTLRKMRQAYGVIARREWFKHRTEIRDYFVNVLKAQGNPYHGSGKPKKARAIVESGN